ncbi:glycoside hydrolase family 16 protein [Ascoidea rubescens DSM 1968]|uniref:Crh-like protein n=1 Tax=Ascoidea rubescens DSM 1968 TaxID=1344418 RepID=A0A1D2VGD2_9ASCO|nr:glycoside hydrolase family 16 protein [Ascoidea rubescens DSM 1968]ODV60721.1 glycoside hydrolase family 16 protein [Ascoidea rubescens DSM 1968]
MLSFLSFLSLFLLFLAPVYSYLDICNPLNTTDECDPNPALAKSYETNFTSNSSVSDFFSVYSTSSQAGTINYTDDGLVLSINKRFDNPSLVSNEYILFGKFEVIAKASPGQGIISTVYLQSDCEDEIDIEWFGGNAYEVCLNFFHQGNTTFWNRSTLYQMQDPREEFHNYTIDWDNERIIWYIDGIKAKVLYNNTSDGFPQTPSRLFIGLWAGGDSDNAEGTILWAGGLTDYDELPFHFYIQRFVITDYSTGDSYTYKDTSGDYDSIEAENGEVLGRVQKAKVEFASLVGGTDESLSTSTARNSTSSTRSQSSTASNDDEEETTTEDSDNVTSSQSSSSEAKAMHLVSPFDASSLHYFTVFTILSISSIVILL